MNDDYVFRSHAEHYDHNLNDGARVKAHMAILAGPDGTEPGIAICVGQHPRLVIPTTDALRIANAIADAVTKQKETQ